MDRPPRVAIVVPTADASSPMARGTLEQTRATTAHLEASIHPVVSSGPDFRFSRSVNRGMAMAPDADAWVLLNDDCRMDPGWLEAMLEAALAHPQVGVVGAVLRYPDGRIQHAGGFVRTMGRHIWDNAIRNRAPFWTARSTWRILRRRSRFLNHYTKVDERQRLDFLTGACILIPRRTVEAIGRFDEGYEFSFEDVDYCLRALEAGLELALATEARGVHLERATGERTGPTIDRSFDRYASLWKAGRIRKVIRRRRRVGVYHAPGGPCGCPPRPS